MVGGLQAWNRTSDRVRVEIRRRVAAGQTQQSVADVVGVVVRTVARVIAEAGGMPSRRVDEPVGRVGVEHREEISRGVSVGETNRSIALRTGFHPSTIGREIERGGGRENYRAFHADRVAAQRRRRPKISKLESDPPLAAAVEVLMRQHLSPQQIAGRLPMEFPDDTTKRVSHETIYRSLFVQGRGGLNKELVKYLRSGRTRRRPHSRAVTGGSRIKDKTMICDRPPEAADRAVPGHYEGDLLMGAKESCSAIATLVERSSRLTLLVPLGRDLTAEHTRERLAELIRTLPDKTFKTLTWDQGIEMARHVQFTIDTGIKVYFCNPHSPWERPTNENTNGLLRQYFPKGTDLGDITQAQCDEVAARLNNRPRKVLDFKTPLECFTGRHIALIA